MWATNPDHLVEAPGYIFHRRWS